MSAHEHDRLSAYLDRELAAEADAEVAAHLQRCEECRQELDLLRLADQAAAALPAEAPAGYFESFAERVSARTAAEPRRAPARGQPRRGARFAPPAWTWALAAALLLAVVTPLTLRQLETPQAARLEEPASQKKEADAARSPEATASLEGTAASTSEAGAPADARRATPASPPLRRQRADTPAGASSAPTGSPAPAAPPTRGDDGRATSQREEVAVEPPSPALADFGSEGALGAASSEAAAGREPAVAGSVPTAPAERREGFTARDKAASPPETPFAAAAEPLSGNAAGQAAGGAARKPLARASASQGARPATFAEYEHDGFRALAERRPASIDEWRRLRDDWLAFGRLQGAGSVLGDEANVRGIGAALEVARASAAADDLAAFLEAARAYLASPQARQKPRVQALLAAGPTSRR